MDEIIIQEYSIEDKEYCVELLKNTFSGFSDNSTFEWRFESRDDEKPILICAKHNDKIVAFNSWLPWKFRYKNEEYAGYQSGESATDINYRRKGIFGKILNYADKVAAAWGIDFMFGIPSSMSYGAFYKAGYHPIGTNYFCVRTVSPLKKRSVNKRDVVKSNNDLFNSKQTQYNKITPIFDFGYLKWRYLDNTKEYEIVEYKENQNKAIFIFRKKIRKGLSELLLLDCQFNSYNAAFVDNAFNYIEKVYTRTVVYIRTYFNDNSHRGITLKKYFPIRFKSKFNIFCVKSISNRIDNNTLFNYYYWDTMPHCVDEL